MKQVDLEFYENCVYGKQKRVHFLKVGKQKKNEKLELVHFDIWGLEMFHLLVDLTIMSHSLMM